MGLSYLAEKLDNAANFTVLQQKSRFASLCGKLDALSPLKVLSRGYAAVFAEDGHAISRVSSLVKGEEITVRMSDGSALATVCDIRESE